MSKRMFTLDWWGISDADVRKRIAELKAEGHAGNEAFRQAVLEKGRQTLKERKCQKPQP